jgi:hypothetical protein
MIAWDAQDACRLGLRGARNRQVATVLAGDWSAYSALRLEWAPLWTRGGPPKGSTRRAAGSPFPLCTWRSGVSTTSRQSGLRLDTFRRPRETGERRASACRRSLVAQRSGAERPRASRCVTAPPSSKGAVDVAAPITSWGARRCQAFRVRGRSESRCGSCRCRSSAGVVRRVGSAGSSCRRTGTSALDHLARDRELRLGSVHAGLTWATAWVLGHAAWFAGVLGVPRRVPVGCPFPNVARHVE